MGPELVRAQPGNEAKGAVAWKDVREWSFYAKASAIPHTATEITGRRIFRSLHGEIFLIATTVFSLIAARGAPRFALTLPP